MAADKNANVALAKARLLFFIILTTVYGLIVNNFFSPLQPEKGVVR